MLDRWWVEAKSISSVFDQGLMFLTWMDGSPKKTFSVILADWQYNCSLHHPLLQLVIRLFFCFFPQMCHFLNVPFLDSTDLGRYDLVGPNNKVLSLFDRQKCSEVRPKPWSQVCGIVIFHCSQCVGLTILADTAFWTNSCLWAYWVIFVMTRKAFFLSLHSSYSLLSSIRK